MTQTNKFSTKHNQPVSLLKAVLIGGGIGLILISFFLSGVNDPNPDWGQYWKLRPLIIVPLAGATGGVFFYFMDLMSTRGMNKTVAVILALVVYVIGLWLGTVLGLDGTLWN
jgi:hypothetical protein